MTKHSVTLNVRLFVDLLFETTLSAAEENLTQSQSDAQQLKSSVKKLESQVENYKSKVQRARLESEDYCLKLEISETNHSTQKQLEEQVRECSILSKQLEQPLKAGQRQVDQSLQRALFKEVQPGQGSGPGEPAGTQ
nr:outer dense fiber protein 2-like [Salvelinus alpinus]